MSVDIRNVRRNKRTGNLHATLYVVNDEHEISATLDYIVTELEKGRYVGHRPKEKEDEAPR